MTVARGPDDARTRGPDDAGTRAEGGDPHGARPDRPPLVIGLTGGIGMGKSTVAAMFAAAGVPVHDADATVHALYARDGAAVEPVGAAFPGTVSGGAVDREALSRAVVGDAEAMTRLEGIVHPLVRAAERDFLSRVAGDGEPIALLDIPLLFETGADARVDRVVVVSAPEPGRRARVLARPGMSEGKLDAIIARQTPDGGKRARADHVVDTGTTIEATRAAVEALIGRLRAEASARTDRG